jgi:hypothetical protein
MFFGEAEIKTNLMCPRCQRKFNDPRILSPCGETLCNTCIEDSSHDNQIDCHFCQVKHPIPAGGFTSNKIIAQMLSLRANEVFRSRTVQSLKEKIARIDKLSDELKSCLENPTLVIGQHCRGMETQIDSLHATRTNELNAMRAELVDKVRSYEQECTNNWHKADTKITVSDWIKQANTLSAKSREYLRDFIIDEHEISVQSRAAEKQLVSLEGQVKWMRSVLFNGGQMLKLKEKESRMEHFASLELKDMSEEPKMDQEKFGKLGNLSF